MESASVPFKILNLRCTITVNCNTFLYWVDYCCKKEKGLYGEYYHINTEDSCIQVNISDKNQSLIQFVCTQFSFTRTTLLQKKAGQIRPLVGHCTACSAIPSSPAQ